MNTFKLHFIPLGGIVGVTKNMYVYELYKDNVLQDIVIVDCGIGFPSQTELGVDFVIPDIAYLSDKVEKIRAILLTHGHEDHISALPFYYETLGRPPVFTSKLTAGFIMNKFKEFNQQINISQVDFAKEYKFGDFIVNFIKVTHSIPDTTHILIKTPVGNMYHGSDFKFDLTPPFGSPPDFNAILKAGRDGILCLLSDCLGSERDGLTLSESIVGQTFEDEMRKTKGKFIMTTFSSNISRIRQCVDAAIKFNRKIIFMGRSMKENTKLASEIGYLPIPKTLMMNEEDVPRVPPNKICLIVAGSQGQYNSALSKLAHKKNSSIKIQNGDKVIISSDPIPGNEDEVYTLIEELTLQGADVIYPDIQDQLHASGHGNREDLKFLIRFTDPKYFIPIGGTIRHQRQYERIVESLGYDTKNAFMLKEGETVWFEKAGAHFGEVIETKNIYVDAYGIGDVGNIVLRDRKTLSTEGIVVAFLMIDNQGNLVTRPKILTRGFIFQKDEDKLIEDGVRVIEKMMTPNPGQLIDINGIKKETETNLEEYLFKQRGRRPLIIVDVIQV